MRTIARAIYTALGVTLAATALCASTGCYHYQFQQRSPSPAVARGGGPASTQTVTHRIRRPTYLNGFVGTGRVDTSQYCANPVRTDLRVRASDVAIAAGTLLIYTPHTLYVTCPAPGLTPVARGGGP